MDIETQLVQFEPAPGDKCRPTSTPIYQSATFEQEFATEWGQYDYSRSGNPTRDVLQSQLAVIENGKAGFAFSSGMAAITCMMSLASSGDEIVLGDDIYGGSYRFVERVSKRQGIIVRHIDTTDLSQVKLTEKTKLLLVETPTNPLLQINDLRELSKICRQTGTLLAVDGTLMSPYLQKPLDLGADIIMHSATKALSGHADLMAGSLAVNDPDLAEQIAFLQNAQGTALGPFECFLVLRGMKTLAIRMDRQMENASELAQRLLKHSAVKKVHYPGFKDHPGHDLHFSQSKGAGPVISVEAGSLDRAVRLVEDTKLFHTTVSFGSLASSISLPYNMSHASIPEDVRKTRRFRDDLVRLSVGIEGVEDLWDDLTAVLDRLETGVASR